MIDVLISALLSIFVVSFLIAWLARVKNNVQSDQEKKETVQPTLKKEVAEWEVVMGLKVLILEDDRERVWNFKKRLVGCNVTTTDDVQECIKLLKSQDWDVIFMDHDLGGTWLANSDETTGYGVACFLKENPTRKPSQMFIHTLNPPGARLMKDQIPEAIYAPQCWLNLKLKKNEEKK